MTRHKRHRVKLRSMYQWHRYIGVTISLLLIHLSVTGIMLNHTSTLELDKTPVTPGWILDWYGIKPPKHVISVQAGGHWISQWDSQLFFNRQVLGQFDARLTGALKQGQDIIIALTDRLLIVSQHGQLIEQLRAEHGLPESIQSLGREATGSLAIRTPTGTFLSDAGMMTWRKAGNPITSWSIITALPEHQYRTLNTLYRSNSLTLERIIQDLHSGRILHQQGSYLTDLIALLIIFLSCSGLWLWLVRRLRQQQPRRKRTHH